MKSTSSQDGCTALHAAVRSGHVDTLRFLLCHLTKSDPDVSPDPRAALALPAALLNRANSDGWTAAHTAAALGLKVTDEPLSASFSSLYIRMDINSDLMQVWPMAAGCLNNSLTC